MFEFTVAPIVDLGALLLNFLSEKTIAAMTDCRWARNIPEYSAKNPDVYICEAYGGSNHNELFALFYHLRDHGKSVILIWTDDFPVRPSHPENTLIFQIAGEREFCCGYGWNSTDIVGPHLIPYWKSFKERQHTACFIGDKNTHPIRSAIFSHSVQSQSDFFIREALWWGPDAPVDRSDLRSSYLATMGNAKFALCPRGLGPSSVRRWEAAYFGAIPVLINDHTTPWGVDGPCIRVDLGDVAPEDQGQVIVKTIRDHEYLGPSMHIQLRDTLSNCFDNPSISANHSGVGHIRRTANSYWTGNGFAARPQFEMGSPDT